MSVFIVESPKKIQTLRRILGKKFIFVATLGHIKDLPENRLGVSLRTFVPKFYYLSRKRGILRELQRSVKNIKKVYLATDPDREGEAIAYHILEFLSKINPNLKFKRLDLIELTEYGIKKALSSPRKIDIKLYEAWLTRRVGDRIIGYLISPYLSKHLKQSLSAGRVQSVALRLIVEREKEIENFQPTKWYTIEALIEKNGKDFWIELYQKNKPYKIGSQEKLSEFWEDFKGKVIVVKDTRESEIKKRPPEPFKTSTLIEMAQKILGYEPKETMKYAQSLYEAGYITYLRTDSTRVSEYARKQAQSYIRETFGKEFVGEPRRHRLSKFSQDAHECIRPAEVQVRETLLSSKEDSLYKLIRNFFLASQMASAFYLEKKIVFKLASSDDKKEDFSFILKGRNLIFEGFLRSIRSYLELKEDEDKIPDFSEGENFVIKDLKIKEHKTYPPQRYTSSSLIKKLESLGIGRPSTYATLVEVLLKRKYIVNKKGYLIPTDLGIRVCEFLMQNFPVFLDYKFTASLEEKLEQVAQGKLSYREIVEEIYEVLKKSLNSDQELRE